MFNTNIPVYSFSILFALIANIFVVFYTSKKYDFTNKEIICLLLYENVGIFIGAKLLTFIQNYSELGGKFNYLSLGLSSYGAVIGAISFLLLFSLQFKKSIKEILYIFMPSLPLMYGIGKIGCFIAGCCFGIEYNGIGYIVYNYSKSAPQHVHLFPIQIIEAVFNIGIFIYVILQHKKNKFNLKTLGIGCIMCGFTKYILEFFRNSHINQIISLTQIISIIIIIVGIGIILYNKKKK